MVWLSAPRKLNLTQFNTLSTSVETRVQTGLRVEDFSDLHMRPYATARRVDVALVELLGNGVVTGDAGPHDLLNDRLHVGSKPPRIGAGGGPAELGNFGNARIAQTLPALFGGSQRGLGAL